VYSFLGGAVKGGVPIPIPAAIGLLNTYNSIKTIELYSIFDRVNLFLNKIFHKNLTIYRIILACILPQQLWNMKIASNRR